MFARDTAGNTSPPATATGRTTTARWMALPDSTRGLAASPNGDTVYAVGDGRAWIIDTATKAIKHTVDLPGTSPFGSTVGVEIEPAADGKSAWILYSSSSFQAPFRLTRIDGSSGAIVSSFTLPQNTSGTRGPAVSPDGSTVYVSQPDPSGMGLDSARLLALDAENGSTVWSTSLGLGSDPPRHSGIAVAPDGSRVYVGLFSFDEADMGIAVVDARTGAIQEKIASGTDAEHLTISQDGQHLLGVVYTQYQNGETRATAVRIDLTKGTVDSRIPIDSGPYQFQLPVDNAADGSTTYAAVPDALAVVDHGAGSVDRVEVPWRPPPGRPPRTLATVAVAAQTGTVFATENGGQGANTLYFLRP